jgi:hypothetical protein
LEHKIKKMRWSVHTSKIWRCVFNSDVRGNLRVSGGQTKVTVTVGHHLWILRWRQKRRTSVPISDLLEGCIQLFQLLSDLLSFKFTWEIVINHWQNVFTAASLLQWHFFYQDVDSLLLNLLSSFVCLKTCFLLCYQISTHSQRRIEFNFHG